MNLKILLPLLFVSAATAADTREFNAITVDLSGAKVWLPSTFVVRKGDTVKINLSTKVPAPSNVHGFAIDAFKVVESVDEKGKTITFKAREAGIFPFRCHLHPAHIGGQLVVLD